MEVMLRCSVPDRPGALAALAGAVATAGGDIEAIDVVEVSGGRALDDLFVAVGAPEGLRSLVEGLESLEDVEVVHTGPSRGHPADAVTRLAMGLEALLNGAMDIEHGLTALVGGLLHASEACFRGPDAAPGADPRTLVVAVGERVMVVRRDYRFTRTERLRAEAVARLGAEVSRGRPAAGAGQVGSGTR
ncbi:MAG: ACT domain-containing protein [Actinomycetota bacterium]|nr:ACT domain-containing protein [Actinomycetota bacterium]